MIQKFSLSKESLKGIQKLVQKSLYKENMGVSSSDHQKQDRIPSNMNPVITTWIPSSRHESRHHYMNPVITTWIPSSLHESLHHYMNPVITTLIPSSLHESRHHYMNPVITTWIPSSLHESRHHDMNPVITTWIPSSQHESRHHLKFESHLYDLHTQTPRYDISSDRLTCYFPSLSSFSADYVQLALDLMA